MSDFYNLSQTKLPENRLIEFGNRTRSNSRKKIDHSNAIERSNERDWVLSNWLGSIRFEFEVEDGFD